MNAPAMLGAPLRQAVFPSKSLWKRDFPSKDGEAVSEIVERATSVEIIGVPRWRGHLAAMVCAVHHSPPRKTCVRDAGAASDRDLPPTLSDNPAMEEEPPGRSGTASFPGLRFCPHRSGGTRRRPWPAGGAVDCRFGARVLAHADPDIEAIRLGLQMRKMIRTHT